MKDQIMIDLETMGSNPNAAIVAIGAVRFDMNPKSLVAIGEDTLYLNVDLQDCMDHGLKVDGKTIMWWLKQSDQAREVLQHGWHKLPQALDILSSFSRGIQGVWCHKTFDTIILDNAYRTLGRSTPWKYRDVLDLRTIDRFFLPGESVDDPDWVPHYAVSDAWHQALRLRNKLADPKVREFVEVLRSTEDMAQPNSKVVNLDISKADCPHCDWVLACRDDREAWDARDSHIRKEHHD